MAQFTPGIPIATAVQLEGMLGTQLRCNSCRFTASSFPVQLYNYEKCVYYEERNILFLQLTDQKPCAYHKHSTDY
jgi:hypothetical protein